MLQSTLTPHQKSWKAREAVSPPTQKINSNILVNLSLRDENHQIMVYELTSKLITIFLISKRKKKNTFLQTPATSLSSFLIPVVHPEHSRTVRATSSSMVRQKKWLLIQSDILLADKCFPDVSSVCARCKTSCFSRGHMRTRFGCRMSWWSAPSSNWNGWFSWALWWQHMQGHIAFSRTLILDNTGLI